MTVDNLAAKIGSVIRQKIQQSDASTAEQRATIYRSVYDLLLKQQQTGKLSNVQYQNATTATDKEIKAIEDEFLQKLLSDGLNKSDPQSVVSSVAFYSVAVGALVNVCDFIKPAIDLTTVYLILGGLLSSVFYLASRGAYFSDYRKKLKQLTLVSAVMALMGGILTVGAMFTEQPSRGVVAQIVPGGEKLQTSVLTALNLLDEKVARIDTNVENLVEQAERTDQSLERIEETTSDTKNISRDTNDTVNRIEKIVEFEDSPILTFLPFDLIGGGCKVGEGLNRSLSRLMENVSKNYQNKVFLDFQIEYNLGCWKNNVDYYNFKDAFYIGNEGKDDYLILMDFEEKNEDKRQFRFFAVSTNAPLGKNADGSIKKAWAAVEIVVPLTARRYLQYGGDEDEFLVQGFFDVAVTGDFTPTILTLIPSDQSQISAKEYKSAVSRNQDNRKKLFAECKIFANMGRADEFEKRCGFKPY